MPTHYGEVRELWRPSWSADRCLLDQENRPARSKGVEVTAPTTEGEEEGSSWCYGPVRRGGRIGGRVCRRGRGGGHGGVGARLSEWGFCFCFSFPCFCGRSFPFSFVTGGRGWRSRRYPHYDRASWPGGRKWVYRWKTKSCLLFVVPCLRGMTARGSGDAAAMALRAACSGLEITDSKPKKKTAL